MCGFFFPVVSLLGQEEDENCHGCSMYTDGFIENKKVTVVTLRVVIP
jgi:hypothetical protein